MINIDEIKNFVYYVANKNGAGTVTPTQFNMFAYRALSEWVLAEYKKYEDGNIITDNLRVLIEERDQLAPNGRIELPDGVKKDLNNQVMPEYLHLSSVRFVIHYQVGGAASTIEKPVKMYSDAEIGNVLDSKIVAPSTSYPAGLMENDHIKIWPSSPTQVVRMRYLRQPNKPEWAYTLVNNRPVYDAANSTDIDAPKEAFNSIAMGILGFLGVNLREQELTGYAETMKTKGV